MLPELLNALEETLVMVLLSGLLTFCLGFPLSIFLFMTRTTLYLRSWVNRGIHIASAMPTIILIIALIPSENYITAIIPLSLAAIPCFIQLCNTAFETVSKGLLEMATVIGASPLQTITKILIPESFAKIISAFTNLLVQLLGYSTIAGALGGCGGLGHLAMQKGYGMFHFDYLLATLLIFAILVQGIQTCGAYIIHGTFKGS
jgi:D-methionine transport system permease protein